MGAATAGDDEPRTAQPQPPPTAPRRHSPSSSPSSTPSSSSSDSTSPHSSTAAAATSLRAHPRPPLPGLMEPASPAATASLAVTVVRHGEGVHNVNTSSIVDAGWSMLSDLLALRMADAASSGRRILDGAVAAYYLHDPPLTPVGVREAAAAAPALRKARFEAVYVSPMLRTVETALHIFGRQAGMRLILHPGCCETRTFLEGSNAGRPRSELESILSELVGREGYVCELDTASYVPEEPWWVACTEAPSELRARAEAFQKFLLHGQPHRCVAVVSHATFLRTLTDDEPLATCEQRTYRCVPQGFIACADGAGPMAD